MCLCVSLCVKSFIKPCWFCSFVQKCQNIYASGIVIFHCRSHQSHILNIASWRSTLINPGSPISFPGGATIVWDLGVWTVKPEVYHWAAQLGWVWSTFYLSGKSVKEVKYKAEAMCRKNWNFFFCLLLCCSCCSLPPQLIFPRGEHTIT